MLASVVSTDFCVKPQKSGERPNMNRRAFLSSLLIAPVAAAIMPRRTAWQRALRNASIEMERLRAAAVNAQKQLEGMEAMTGTDIRRLISCRR